jgi:hypothetical protein
MWMQCKLLLVCGASLVVLQRDCLVLSRARHNTEFFGRQQCRSTNYFCPDQGFCGYSGQAGIPPSSHDHSALEPQNMRALGMRGGSLSSEPAGITARLRSGATLGNGLPHAVQKEVRNRLASGTLNPPSLSSPAVHFTLSGLSRMLLAWPVPLAFRQRWQ